MNFDYLRLKKEETSAPDDYDDVKTECIPPGVYRGRVLPWRWRTDKGGKRYLEMRYRIEVGEYAGCNLWDRLYWTAAAKGRTHRLMDRLGLYAKKPLDTSVPVYVEIETVLSDNKGVLYSNVDKVRRLESLDDTPTEQSLTGANSAIPAPVVSDTFYPDEGRSVDELVERALTELDSDIM